MFIFRCTAKWFSFTYVCVCLHVCVCVSVCVYIYIYVVFQLLFPCKLLQNREYSSPCYTVGPCWCKPSASHSDLQGTPKGIMGGAKTMVGRAKMIVGGALRMMEKKRWVCNHFTTCAHLINRDKSCFINIFISTRKYIVWQPVVTVLHMGILRWYLEVGTPHPGKFNVS